MNLSFIHRRFLPRSLVCALSLASITPLMATPPATFNANITNGTTTIVVNYVLHPIRGANFHVYFQDAAGVLNPVAAPEACTYIGTVTGYPGAIACALRQDNGTLWEYVIFEAGDQWWADNGTVTRTYGSPTFTPTWPTSAVVTPAQADVVKSVVAGDVIADIPYSNFTNTHGSSVDHAVYVTEFCLMETNLIYLRDLGFLHRIGRVVIRGTQATDPYQTGDKFQTLRGQFGPFVGHEALKFLTVPDYGGGASLLGTVGDWYSGASICGSDGRGDAFIIWRHEVGHNHGAGDGQGGYCENYTLLNANQVGRLSGPEEAAMINSRQHGYYYNASVLENLGTYPAFNLPPRASLDLAYGEPGVPVRIDVMANDHDSNGDAISLLSFDSVSAHGATITRSAGTGTGGRDQIIYTGTNDYKSGFDSFQYRIQDSNGSQALGNVYVDVAPGELCAYWPMNEATGTVASNHSISADATLYNGATWTTGTINNALGFNGVNQYAKSYVNVPEAESAVSFWFRTSVSGGGLYCVTNDSGVHDRDIFLNGGNISARIYNEETVSSTGQNLANGQWHQVVHTFGATVGGQKIYVDGVLVASGTKTLSDFTTQTAVILGYSASSPTQYFNGQMDDVRIWNRSLSEAEAVALTQRSGTANYPNPPLATIVSGQNLTLDWLAPTGATSHDLYLGDFAGVVDGTTASSTFKGNLTTKPYVSSDTPPGYYYWRADERRDTTVFKGPTWYFQYVGGSNSNAVNLAQPTNWWVNANDTSTQSGVIGGTSALYKEGPGTLILTGDNTYSGGTIIQNGVLQIGNGGTTGSLGTGAVTVNATLTFNRSDSVIFNGTLNGTGNVVQSGSGNLTLSGGGITYSGTTILNAGSLTLTATPNFNSAIQINAGQLTFNATGNHVMLPKIISGAGPVQVNGDGIKWTYMTADNTYSGGTVINSGGMLLLGNNTTTGSVLGDITNNGTLGLYRSNAWTFSNNVTGNGALSLYSPGGNSVTVSGNTISLASLTAYQNPGGILGNTTVNLTGALNLASNSTLTIANSANVTVAGGMTQVGNAYTHTMSYLRMKDGSLTFGSPINDGWDGAYTVVQTGGTIRVPGITGGNGGGTSPTDTYCLEGGSLIIGANGIWGPYYKYPWFPSGGGLTMVLNLGGGTLSASSNWSTSWAATLTGTNGDVTFNPAGYAITMSGPLGGTGGLNLAGSGSLLLSGANTFTGGVTIINGALRITGSGKLGDGTYSTNITNNGSISYESSSAQTLSGAISGTGSLGMIGTGSVTLNGAASNTYTGTTTLYSSSSNVVLTLAKTGDAVAIPGNLTFGNGSATVNDYIRMTQNNQFGAGSVLSFINNIGGYTRFELQGTTQTVAGINDALGAGVIQNSENGVGGNSTLVVNGAVNSAYRGYLRNGSTGTLALVKSGTGTLTLYGPNIYNSTNILTGGTSISEGTLKLDLTARATNSALNLGTISVGSGGILELYNGVSPSYSATDLTSGGTAFTGTGTIIKTGTGIVDWWSTSSTVTTSIKNFAGLIDVQQGTLANQTNSDWSASAGNMNLNIASGAFFDLRTASAVINNLTGSGAVGSSYSTGMILTVGAQGGSSTFNGVIQNTVPGYANSPTVGLTKAGAGTFTLPGTHTYTGATTISNGTLLLTGTLANTAITINGGILQIGNGGTTGNPGTGALTDNGTLTINRSDSVTFNGNLPGTGGINQIGTGNLALSGSGITYAGTTNLNVGTMTLTSTSGFNSSIQLNGGQATFNATSNYVMLPKTISGTGPVQVNGSGSNWTYMSADNTYTGGTVINSGGMLLLGNNSSSGSVQGDITDNGTLGLYHSNAWTFSNNVSGTGLLSLYSPGGNAVTVGGGNTISLASLNANQNPGGILSNTTVNLTGALNLVSGSTLTVADGANVTATGGMTQGGNAYTHTMSYLRVTGGTLTLGAPINDGWDGAYTVIQTGGVVRAPGITGGNGGGTSPIDTYSLEGGSLIIGANGIWGPYYKYPWFPYGGGVTMVLNLGGGTLSASANWSTAWGGTLTGTGGNLTVDPTGFSITMTGPLGGTGGINLIGSGTLVLAGANTYSGTTTIAATTTLGGAGGMTGPVINNGTLSPGNNGTGILAVNNTLTLAPGSTISWQVTDCTGSAGSSYDQIAVNALNLTATTESPVTIKIISQSIAHVPDAEKAFILIQNAGTITGFDPAKFVLDTTAFPTGLGTWSIRQSGNNVELVYCNSFQGKWTHELYTNIGGSGISSLIGTAGLLRTPDLIRLSDSTEVNHNSADNYGERFRATITVPTTGSYTFWIAGEDSAELWLSTNERKFSKRKIAFINDLVQVAGSSAFRNWDQNPSQESVPVTLQTGQSYYIEVLHKAAYGDDHVSLAWQGPGFTRELLPSSVLTSYSRDADDSDDDCLVDSWESAEGLSNTDNGLTNFDNGEYGDPDGDGICNRDEWLLGTKPRNADTDGDGYSDGEEVYFMGTNPLVAEVTNPSVIGDIAVDASVNASATWAPTADGGVLSMETRGWIEYSVSVTTPGYYLFEIRGRARGSAIMAREDFPLDVYVDTKKAAFTVLTSLNGQSGLSAGFAGWLTAGDHTLRIWNRNLLGRRALQLDSMRIIKPEGAITNANGIPDWLNDYLLARNTLSSTGTGSLTSPCCVEGITRNLEATTISANSSAAAPVTKGVDNHWFSNVTLNAGADTPVSIGFENGTFHQDLNIEWTRCNLAANSHLVIRKDDKLRLTAFTVGGSPDHSDVVLTLNNQSLATTPADEPFVHQFTTAGTYTLTATYNGSATANTVIDVLAADFGAVFPVYMQRARLWNLPNVPAVLPLENDKTLLLTPQTASGSGRAFTVDTSSLGFNTILARAGTGGPVLATGQVEGTLLSHSSNYELPVIYTYPNGDRVVELTVMATSLPNGGYLSLEIWLGGRLFIDGTTVKRLYAADFDQNGVARVQLILSSGVGTTCHRTYLRDAAGNIIGQM